MKHTHMKQLLITVLAACSLSATYAQKSSVLLFGNVSGANNDNSSEFSESKQRQFFLDAGVGYQISKHVTLGVQGGYHTTFLRTSITTNGVLATSETSYSGLDIGAFGRYTHYLGERFFVYVQGEAGYGVIGSDNTNLPASDPSASYVGNIFPAVGCFIYKGWALNLNIGTVGFRYSNEDGVKNSRFYYNLGNSVIIGVSKNFTKRTKAPMQ